MSEEHKYMELNPSEYNPDDDILVEEYPIFLSQELNQQLHLIQYNNKSIDLPYHTQPCNIQYKSIQHILSLQYPFNHTLEQKDSFAVNDEPTHNITGITLNSSLVPIKLNYAVGIIRDKQLHLTSVDNILKMKPDFTHIDKQQEANKLQQQPVDENESDNEDGAQIKNDNNDIQPMVVKYKKRDNERTAALKKLSYQYLHNLQQSEPSVALDYIDGTIDNNIYSDSVERLICDSGDAIPILPDKQSYINYIKAASRPQNLSVKRP